MAYTGSSIVDYLNSVGQDSSYANRTKLAAANNITGYVGSAAQNTQLLGLLNKPAAPVSTSGTSTAYPLQNQTGMSSAYTPAGGLSNVGVTPPNYNTSTSGTTTPISVAQRGHDGATGYFYDEQGNVTGQDMLYRKSQENNTKIWDIPGSGVTAPFSNNAIMSGIPNQTGTSSAANAAGMDAIGAQGLAPFNNPVSQIMTPLQQQPIAPAAPKEGKAVFVGDTTASQPAVTKPATLKPPEIAAQSPTAISVFNLKDGNTFKGTQAQYDAYVKTHPENVLPKEVVTADVPTKISSSIFETALGNYDINKLLGENKKLQEEFTTALQLSPKEIEVQAKLDKIRADAEAYTNSFEEGNQLLLDQNIPLQFITGQQASLKAQYQQGLAKFAAQEKAAMVQLDLEQQIRQTKVDALKAKVGFGQEDAKMAIGLQEKIDARDAALSKANQGDYSVVRTGTDENGEPVYSVFNAKTGLIVGNNNDPESTPFSATDVDEGIVQGYDIITYASDPAHEAKVANIVSSIGQFRDSAQVQAYISRVAPGSPVTAQMVAQTSTKYNVPQELLVAMMQQDSSLGTAGLAVSSMNPGNVGTFGGKVGKYPSWAAGVDAVGKWLSGHKADPAKLTQAKFSTVYKPIGNLVISGLPGTQQKFARQTFNNLLAAGAENQVKGFIITKAKASATAESKTQQEGRERLTADMDVIANLFKQYEAAGGKPGFWLGTEEEIRNKVGNTKDPKLAYINNQILQSFVNYRRSMTGVAFSPSESATYEKIFPAVGKQTEFNQAVIDSIRATTLRNSKIFYETQLGGEENLRAIFGDAFDDKNVFASSPQTVYQTPTGQIDMSQFDYSMN